MSTASKAVLCMSATLIAPRIDPSLRYHVMVFYTLLLGSRLNNIEYRSTGLGLGLDIEVMVRVMVCACLCHYMRMLRRVVWCSMWCG